MIFKTRKDGEMCHEEMIQGNESLQKECTSESTDEEDGILEEVMAFADFYPTEDNQVQGTQFFKAKPHAYDIISTRTLCALVLACSSKC